MESIRVRNVNHALPLALSLLRDTGIRVAPRGQATLEIPGPFATTYCEPQEMVLFDPERDANPFFQLFESIWVLAGRDDVQFLAYFLPRMAEFSDDGKKFHAPYGYRLRSSFGFDQIEFCIKALTDDPNSRQAVMSIWDPALDWRRTLDKPCNDMVLLKIRNAKLRMTVCNRSNDAIWGAYGTNVVQFSMLLSYMAARIGVAVGEYTQMSDSFHVYEENPYWKLWLATHSGGVPTVHDPYEQPDIYKNTHGTEHDECAFMAPSEISSGAFDDDLQEFFKRWDSLAGNAPALDGSCSALLNERAYHTNSFADVLLPMLVTLINWRSGHKQIALETVKHVKALDWQLAATNWMERRNGNSSNS